MELPRRAPVGGSVVIVGLELTEFITGAAGKVGPTGVIVLEAGFKVGVLICWHNAETTNCPRRVMTTRNPHSNFIVVFSFVTPRGAFSNTAPTAGHLSTRLRARQRPVWFVRPDIGQRLERVVAPWCAVSVRRTNGEELLQRRASRGSARLVQAGDYAAFNFQPPLLRHLIFFTFPLFYLFV
jgi:hypothetical protein